MSVTQQHPVTLRALIVKTTSFGNFSFRRGRSSADRPPRSGPVGMLV
jgi:hypothetical protein